MNNKTKSKVKLGMMKDYSGKRRPYVAKEWDKEKIRLVLDVKWGAVCLSVKKKNKKDSERGDLETVITDIRYLKAQLRKAFSKNLLEQGTAGEIGFVASTCLDALKRVIENA